MVIHKKRKEVNIGMRKQEIGKFYAKSFNDIVFEFIVFDDNTIDCPNLGLYDSIELKPRFELRGHKTDEDGNFYDFKSYIYDVKSKEKFKNPLELIGEYDIDEELFDYLKQNEMIRYSTDMAYLYGFSDTKGYDSNPGHNGVGSPYKWAKKKGPILERQRNGQFN